MELMKRIEPSFYRVGNVAPSYISDSPKVMEKERKIPLPKSVYAVRLDRKTYSRICSEHKTLSNFVNEAIKSMLSKEPKKKKSLKK